MFVDHPFINNKKIHCNVICTGNIYDYRNPEFFSSFLELLKVLNVEKQFKILGIILFIIEIVWFILLPIWREIKQWWGLRRYMRFNWTSLRSIFIFSVFLAAMLVPWRSSLSLPAVIDRGEVVDIYPTEDSEIKEIFVISDQQVEKGDLLITMMSPSLSNKVDKAIERVKMIQQKLDRRIGSEADMSNLMVLENQLKVELIFHQLVLLNQ